MAVRQAAREQLLIPLYTQGQGGRRAGRAYWVGDEWVMYESHNVHVTPAIHAHYQLHDNTCATVWRNGVMA